jgi:branched-chain amino acid transport system ATP-binding protein
MPELLAVEALSAGYDGVPVVRDLSLHVDAGEVVALLGPNGAGKTTTLSATSPASRPTGAPAAACRWCPRAGRCSSA